MATDAEAWSTGFDRLVLSRADVIPAQASRHPRAGGDPAIGKTVLVAGTASPRHDVTSGRTPRPGWVSACAGMTVERLCLVWSQRERRRCARTHPTLLTCATRSILNRPDLAGCGEVLVVGQSPGDLPAFGKNKGMCAAT